MLVNRYLSVVVPTSTTEHYFERNVKFLRPLFSLIYCLLILMGQKEGTVEAVQTTWGGHLRIIHNELSL
jgi:hypothetical protein